LSRSERGRPSRCAQRRVEAGSPKQAITAASTPSAARICSTTPAVIAVLVFGLTIGSLMSSSGA